ncbi:MAG: transposase [Chloroflexi bacterium]|nr:transposase [Chloroflexota bacterium]
MAKQKRYGKEFKLGAARLVVEQGYTHAEAAERLGVAAWSIGRWIKQLRESGELPSKNQPVAESEELKGLRKENKQLRMENDILKKAAAYFAKESL